MGLSAVKDDVSEGAEKHDNDNKKNNLDELGKGNGKGNYARECPSVAGPHMGTQ